jgi:hypothetical protein
MGKQVNRDKVTELVSIGITKEGSVLGLHEIFTSDLTEDEKNLVRQKANEIVDIIMSRVEKVVDDFIDSQNN